MKPLSPDALARVRGMLPVWLRHVPLDERSPARVLLEVGREWGRLEAVAAAYASDPLNNLAEAPPEKDGSAGQSVDQWRYSRSSVPMGSGLYMLAQGRTDVYQAGADPDILAEVIADER